MTKAAVKKMVGDLGNGITVRKNWMTGGYIVFWHDAILAMPTTADDLHWYLTVDLRIDL